MEVDGAPVEVLAFLRVSQILKFLCHRPEG